MPWKDGKWVNDAGQEAPQEMKAPGAFDILGLLSEMKSRLEKVESDNAAMRSEMSAARSAGDLDFDKAHVVHVMDKHFYHDRPEPAVTN